LFGPLAAPGLAEFVAELQSMPDVEVVTYWHPAWSSLVDDINRQPQGTRILVIGYSLGANNSVLVANNASYIDSIIALQPSIFTSNTPLTGKVGRMSKFIIQIHG
jgi:dienelactone hydrolase